MNPVNEIEKKIEEILVSSGVAPEEIEFSESLGMSPSRYLRIGYWRSLPNDILVALGDLITSEESDYDEDCGYLYMYRIAEKK